MKARLPKGVGGGPQNMQAMLKQHSRCRLILRIKRQSLRKGIRCFLSGGYG
jgi:hypothetical protein